MAKASGTREAEPRQSGGRSNGPSTGPSTPRGQATRASLVRAAREVFERDGFLDARITDITATAGTATGSFYNYFRGKEEIFAAVVEVLNEEMSHPMSLQLLIEDEDDPDLVLQIADRHRAYLQVYQRNARLMSVVEQVTNISDEFRHERTTNAVKVLRRNAAAIRRLQADGHADPDLDPMLAARSLAVMVSRAAYATFILDEETEIEGLAQTLTRLLVNALRLKVDPGALDRLGDGPRESPNAGGAPVDGREPERRRSAGR
jgi:AcrR family transcriptional regulator